MLMAGERKWDRLQTGVYFRPSTQSYVAMVAGLYRNPMRDPVIIGECSASVPKEQRMLWEKKVWREFFHDLDVRDAMMALAHGEG